MASLDENLTLRQYIDYWPKITHPSVVAAISYSSLHDLHVSRIQYISFGRPCMGIAFLCLALAVAGFPQAAAEPATRARDLGIPFDGQPGPFNAITDVAGVEVGHATLVENKESGDGAITAVRTGVTAVFPKGKDGEGFVYAGVFSLNGTGELTGRSLIEELGMFSGPVMTTGTASVGIARDAVTEWYSDRLGSDDPSLFQYLLPVVGETYDGNLNATYGFHVHKEHVFAALESAQGGAVREGSVGGGTGAICFAFKCGIGTASRLLPADQGNFTVGVLVQANFGARRQLNIAGVPVGSRIRGYEPRRPEIRDGSIIIVIATDAPLIPHQLERLARRASHGMARTGGMSGNTSGDIFIAFSTAVPERGDDPLLRHTYVDTWHMNPLLEATVLATEEAIVNALVAARTMEGRNGAKVFGLPHDRLREIMRDFNRLVE